MEEKYQKLHFVAIFFILFKKFSNKKWDRVKLKNPRIKWPTTIVSKISKFEILNVTILK